MEQSSPILTINPVEPNKGIKDKLKSFFTNLKYLPVKSKGLLSLVVVATLLVAIPATVVTLVTTKTSFFNRAASGEASGEPPCTPSLPQASIAPSSVTAYAGETKNFVVTIKDQCTGGSYQAVTIKGGDFWGTVSPALLTLSPNQTGTFNVSFGTSGTAKPSIYGVGLSIIGPGGTTSANAQYTILAGTPPPTPKPTCQSRPACLDATPLPGGKPVRCLLPEPAGGWCPIPTPIPTPTPVACKQNPQTVTLTPQSQSGLPGQSLLYNINVTNNNSAGCPTSTFYFSATPPSTDWLMSLANSAFSLSSGTSATAQVKFASPIRATPNGYPVGVSVKGPAYNISATGSYVVIKPTPMPTPKPTPIPTPVPIPSGSPVISTLVLPVARVRNFYSAIVNGYDTTPYASLSMTITNLPAGLYNGPCALPLIGLKQVNRQPTISCTIMGTPRSWGLTLIRATLRDNYGKSTSRDVYLWVSPF